MTTQLERLIDAAESHAEHYEGDDRQDIKTDVMNAFFAGAKWQAENAPIAKDFATLEKAIRVAAVMEAIKAIKPNKDGYTSPKLRPMMESIHVISEMNCEIIQTLITEEGNDALRELCIKVAKEADEETARGYRTDEEIIQLVDRIMKGE